MGMEIVAHISSDSHALSTSERANPQGMPPNLQIDFELPLAELCVLALKLLWLSLLNSTLVLCSN